MAGKVQSEKRISQSQRFIDKARELGCDEDEQAFADKVRRIAKAPPPKRETVAKSVKRSK